MPYGNIRFGEVELPANMVTDDLSTGDVESTLLASIGGVFDLAGSGPRLPRKHMLTHKGLYVGYREELVDETGDFLVDETGDTLIAGEAVTMLQSQIDALKAKVGERDILWRQRQADGALSWKEFRFLRCDHTQGDERAGYVSIVTCQFESAMGGGWRAETLTTVSGSAINGVLLSLFVDNAGETIEDAVITITRTTGALTLISLTCAELGISWQWTGSLNSGHVLTVDAGRQTVADNTTDAYSGFTLPGHTAQGWMTLSPGGHMLTLRVTGGNASVAFSYYAQSD